MTSQKTGCLTILDDVDLRVIVEIQTSFGVLSLAQSSVQSLSQAENTITAVAACSDGWIRFYECTSISNSISLSFKRGVKLTTVAITDVKVSPHSKRCAASSLSGKIYVLDAASPSAEAREFQACVYPHGPGAECWSC
eukprot:CAMPEP_0182453528 /NCGR_PEP_ID=MMETSP1319-20130603/552_1 /TAXON_ID=172717 /ORGANISM="Bolidomonas pacifica, Strain RCC208" /LENGTH=137 /DNA_ID=CAMNT_0024651467 /DNA_START=209 /DNA_END=619 /DNA_ORIENTATION=-